LKEGQLIGVEVGEFTVLTGPNGSGKSNLLEGLAQGNVIYDDFGVLEAGKARLFRLNELITRAEDPVAGAQFKEPWATAYNQVQGIKRDAEQQVNLRADQRRQYIYDAIYQQQLLTSTIVTKLEADIGRAIWDASIADFQEHAPLILGVRDPFATSISELFLTYNARWIRHRYARWSFEEEGSKGTPPATDAEFFAKYGPKPWDLFNDTLKIVGLPYVFESPPNDTEAAQYQVTLENEQGQKVLTGDLSSGERVLLAVAMSLFTGTNMSESIQLPRLLLLDEADASLHPSMVRSLLTVIQDVFVSQYGVRVMLATHAPSTVALAPEESIYVMSRVEPRLRKASTDEALRFLTVGISALSVRLENRRQIFVESEYDQDIFQAYFAALKTELNLERSAEFIAAGRRDVGGGSTRVIDLVTALRSAGNPTVSGIVDRDNRQGTPEHVHYIADRYSVENVVFDPLMLGTFLLREQVVSAKDLGLPASKRSFEVTEHDAQSMIDAVAAPLGFSGSHHIVAYVGGFSANVPEEFLETQGHALEAAIVATFAPLNRFGKSLKLEVVRRAVGDQPKFVPAILAELFKTILAD